MRRINACISVIIEACLPRTTGISWSLSGGSVLKSIRCFMVGPAGSNSDIKGAGIGWRFLMIGKFGSFILLSGKY